MTTQPGQRPAIASPACASLAPGVRATRRADGARPAYAELRCGPGSLL